MPNRAPAADAVASATPLDVSSLCVNDPSSPVSGSAADGTMPARRRVIAAASGAAVLGSLPRFAIGQGAWPNKPVRVIVTNPPGGLTDAYARQYSEAMSRKFGQPFVVDNRPGAGGIIAAVGTRAEVEAAHSAPRRIDARGKAMIAIAAPENRSFLARS